MPASSSQLDEQTRQRVRAISATAAALPPHEREPYIHSACGPDTLLRAQVFEELTAVSNASPNSPAPAPAYREVTTETRTMRTPVEGQIIGAYRLGKKISEGGMGMIYRAERADGKFQRAAAVKFILGDLTGPLRQRFDRETRVLAALQHPNLVLLYDAGETNAGVPYLVMEFVAGETLQELLERRGVLPIAETLRITQQTAAGLEAAHREGVIHRDIKPANLMVTYDQLGLPHVKVLDFGIAFPQYEDRLSRTDSRIGTLLYMSPEQIVRTAGAELTPASDVYALAAVTYEMLTGQVFFYRRQKPLPPFVARLHEGLPPALETVLRKGLADEPLARYQSALDFAHALIEADGLARTVPVSAPLQHEAEQIVRTVSNRTPGTLPSAPQATLVEAPSAPTLRENPTSTAQPIPPLPNPGNYWPLVGGLLLLLALGSGAFYRWQNKSVETTAVTPPAANSTQANAAAPVSQPTATANQRLKLRLNIVKRAALPETGCTFALFKPEITQVPAPGQIKAEQLQLIITGLGRQAEGDLAQQAPIAPGTYWSKFACNAPTHTPITNRVTVAPDPQNPGSATVTVN